MPCWCMSTQTHAHDVYTSADALFGNFEVVGTDRDRRAPKVQEGRGQDATLVHVSLGAPEGSVVSPAWL